MKIYLLSHMIRIQRVNRIRSPWLMHIGDEVAKLEAENEELMERNNQSTYCAYCGEDFPLDIEHTTLRVGIHIWECEKHPLNILCANIEERCKDLDMDAQENLEQDNVQHASGIHKAIDKIRAEVDAGKLSCQRMRDALRKETPCP